MDLMLTVPSLVHPALVKAYSTVVFKRMKTNNLQNPVSCHEAKSCLHIYAAKFNRLNTQLPS